MSDPAAFHNEHVIAVYGEYPCCLITGTRRDIVDLHHIIGRGYREGIRPASPDRKYYSSIYNCCPLSRTLHDSFCVNNKHFQRMLLELVGKRVQDAQRDGRYEETDIDVAFRHEVLPEWEAKHFPVYS